MILWIWANVIGPVLVLGALGAFPFVVSAVLGVDP